MQRITIGRYKPYEGDEPLPDGATQVSDLYNGWIEGIRDDGTGWIMWLDSHGNPDVFWPHRDEGGGIMGTPIVLGRDLPTLESNSTVTPA
jgi:hypothetical protein